MKHRESAHSRASLVLRGWRLRAAILLACLCVLAPRPVIASVYELVADTAFFEGRTVRGDELVLEYSLILGGELAPSPDKFSIYDKPHGKKLSECAVPTELYFEKGFPEGGLSLGCGVRVLALGTYIEPEYFFLVKRVRKNWVEIVADPKTGKTTWMHAPEPPKKIKPEIKFKFRVRPLTEWLFSYDSFSLSKDLRGKKIGMYANPELGSETGKCEGGRINQSLNDEGMAPGVARVVGLYRLKRPIRGDWFEAECPTEKCVSMVEREIAAANGESTSFKKKGLCPRGWFRWKTDQGKLLVYPQNLTGGAD